MYICVLLSSCFLFLYQALCAFLLFFLSLARSLSFFFSLSRSSALSHVTSCPRRMVARSVEKEKAKEENPR
uniref:Putative secreted protein n=1 Tax=Anopheles darlingi TaxID=43151 RepID=A0A2M4D1M6_ANODA